jgi:hypothetical protein
MIQYGEKIIKRRLNSEKKEKVSVKSPGPWASAKALSVFGSKQN